MFLLLVISNVSPFAPTESFVPFGGGGGHPSFPPLFRPTVRVRARVRVLHIANAFKKKKKKQKHEKEIVATFKV